MAVAHSAHVTLSLAVHWYDTTSPETGVIVVSTNGLVIILSGSFTLADGFTTTVTLAVAAGQLPLLAVTLNVSVVAPIIAVGLAIVALFK